MKILNLGILAHVDAGKTSLTERLLFNAGVINHIGSVDAGNTQTDSLELERKRGITIKSAVVSFMAGDTTINLIDTPGHSDFIAEVERSLSVLDGAVLVISAVEGVQAQTRVLMRTLKRLHIPTVFFVNKTDRMGADPERVKREIQEKLTPDAITLDADGAVFCGSAITGAGIEALTAGITQLLPLAHTDAAAPVAGSVFKIERGPAGEKIAFVRLFAGTIRPRERLEFGVGHEAKVTAISVFEHGGSVQRPSITAGQIGKLWGLAEVRIGDSVGAPRAERAYQFAPPTLETVVLPSRPSEKGTLHAALAQLAEQDPLINLRQDDIRGELFVSLYGEVQKEVIEATLLSDFGLKVGFEPITAICIERLVGVGAAVVVGERGDPYLGTVGLRLEPAEVGSGIRFALAVSPGAMPAAFYKAVEETVPAALASGLSGWRVTDLLVTMTHSGYWPRQSHAHATFDKSMSSTAGDFRTMTRLAIGQALEKAGTQVYEPVHQFELELPADTLSTVLPVLARVRAIPGTPAMRGEMCVLEGTIPAAQIYDLQQQLPALTRGEGVMECSFSHYQ